MGAMMAMIAEQDCELTDKNKPSYLPSSTEYIVYTLLTALNLTQLVMGVLSNDYAWGSLGPRNNFQLIWTFLWTIDQNIVKGFYQ